MSARRFDSRLRAAESRHPSAGGPGNWIYCLARDEGPGARRSDDGLHVVELYVDASFADDPAAGLSAGQLAMLGPGDRIIEIVPADPGPPAPGDDPDDDEHSEL
jgi:hypothetical protein